LLEILRSRSIIATQSKHINQHEKVVKQKRKRKQYKSKEENEKARLARQKSRNKKKIKCKMMKNEIEKLKKKIKELKGKVKKLKEELRERIENEEMCEEECLHNNVEKFKSIFLPLSNNFILCFLDLKKVKYITQLLLIKFSDFVNEVAPSISCLT
jgi:molecular chaperone GrpE (heat shock protein)